MNDLLDDLASGDDERAENAIPAIVRLGAAVLPPLLELTHARDADVRWWAVYALAALTHTRAEHLLPLLTDSAPDVRAAAALALCSHPEESAIPSLINALADEDSLAATTAMTALIKIGNPAVASLVTAMTDAPAGARILALRALSEIGDHRAIPVLLQAAGAESAVLQYWAQMGLERLGLNMVYIKP